jgi:hypothetical protein
MDNTDMKWGDKDGGPIMLIAMIGQVRIYGISAAVETKLRLVYILYLSGRAQSASSYDKQPTPHALV